MVYQEDMILLVPKRMCDFSHIEAWLILVLFLFTIIAVAII